MIRLIALALIAVASLTYAIFQHWEATWRDDKISQLNTEIAAARQGKEDAQAALVSLREELATAKDNVARLQAERDAAVARLKSSPGSTAVSATEAAAAPGNAGDEKPQGAAAFAKMFESEEGRKMMKSQGAMMTRMMYGELARVLKLSPQDADQVMAMLSDRQSAMAEGQFKFMGEGKFDEKAATEMASQSEAVKKEYDAKLKGILGEEKFQQMQEYERTLGDRMALVQYDQSFNAAGVPLQADQREALLGIMSRERKNSPPPIMDSTGQDPAKSFAAMRDPASIDKYFAQEEDYQRRVLAEATKTLNPDQINALQQGFKQFADMQKFGMKMMQQMMKDGDSIAPAPAPPRPVEPAR